MAVDTDPSVKGRDSYLLWPTEVRGTGRPIRDPSATHPRPILNLTKTGALLSMGWVLGFIVWGLALSGNLGYIGGGIDLSYGQCARSQGWPRSPYHLLWFGCYRSPGRDGRMKNRFGRLHLGCLQWCLVEECGKLRVSCCRGVKPRQPSRVFTRRAALYVAMLKRSS